MPAYIIYTSPIDYFNKIQFSCKDEKERIHNSIRFLKCCFAEDHSHIFKHLENFVRDKNTSLSYPKNKLFCWLKANSDPDKYIIFKELLSEELNALTKHSHSSEKKIKDFIWKWMYLFLFETIELKF
jgi:hypothetical protein